MDYNSTSSADTTSTHGGSTSNTNTHMSSASSGENSGSGSNDTININETTQFIIERMIIVKEQFFSVLEDFKKNYILHNKNPDQSEYASAYNENKTQLQTLQKTMFSINNTIQSSTDKLSDVKNSLETKLESLKEKIDNLEIITAALSQSGDGSETMKDDFVILYNYQYLQNFCLFIGVIITLSLFGTLFKNKNGSSPLSASSYSSYLPSSSSSSSSHLPSSSSSSSSSSSYLPSSSSSSSYSPSSSASSSSR